MKEKFLSPNLGYGPEFSFIDIGLKDKICIIEPETCFWGIVETDEFIDGVKGLLEEYLDHEEELKKEMKLLRFGLKPSAVYFNPTEKCNLNCKYCYIPKDIRRYGVSMTKNDITRYLTKLKEFFGNFDFDVKPQIIFHGSEPLMLKDEIFESIEEFKDDFIFGIQTNGTLLTSDDISFIKDRDISIGVSLDGVSEEVANKTRTDWSGKGYFDKVIKVIEEFADYPKLNVMVTVTKHNQKRLSEIVDFFHTMGVCSIMLNPVRCTQEGGRELKPEDESLLKDFISALDRAFYLFERTGRKIVISNFANLISAILGPTTRKLMCDISPCGGGRCFFALGARGDVFPCSEFIGIEKFNGGNINSSDLEGILNSRPFKEVTSRKIELFYPCSKCSIRHFCGAPCPAEVYNMYGNLSHPSPYCFFYQGLVQYAFRLIASGKEKAFLWNDWEKDVDLVYEKQGD